MFPVQGFARTGPELAADLRGIAEALESGQIKGVENIILLLPKESGDVSMFVTGKPMHRLYFLGMLQRILAKESLL